MKRYLLFVVLALISITGFSQTYNSLPAGFVAYTTGTYKNPAGVVIMGTAAGKFRVITQQQVLDSLLALKVTLNPISPQSGNISLDNSSIFTIKNGAGTNSVQLHPGGGAQFNNGSGGSATVQAGGIIQVASSSGATSITPGGNIWGGDGSGNDININSNVVNVRNTLGEGITATKYGYTINTGGNNFTLRPNASPLTTSISAFFPAKDGTLATLADITDSTSNAVKLSPTSSQSGNIDLIGNIKSDSFSINGVGNYSATNGIYSAALEGGGLTAYNGVTGYTNYGRNRISNTSSSYAKYIDFGYATGSNKNIEFPDLTGDVLLGNTTDPQNAYLNLNGEITARTYNAVNGINSDYAYFNMGVAAAGLTTSGRNGWNIQGKNGTSIAHFNDTNSTADNPGITFFETLHGLNSDADINISGGQQLKVGNSPNYARLKEEGLYVNNSTNLGFVGPGFFQAGDNDSGIEFGQYYGDRIILRNAGAAYGTAFKISPNGGGYRDITFPDASGTVALTTDLGDYVSKSGTTMTGDLLLSSATPSNALSAVPKSYVDNAITGITWKNAVRVATLVNIALSGTGTIDGVALAVGNRVLVKNQTTSADNGIYIVAAGAWTRATDADSSDEINTATVAVTSGTSQKNTQWTTTSTITTVGTDPITFGQISGAGTYTNGTNMALTGNVFSTSLTPTFTTVNATTFTGTLSGNATTATTTAAVSGTTNQVPKFTSSTNIGNSSIFDNGSAVGLSTGSPTSTAGGLDISSGGLSLIIGGDSGGSSRTNNTQKLGRIGAFHYINSEEPLAILHANSNTSNSTVSFGGGTALMNAATELAFFTANNTTTTAGSQRMIIDGAGSIGIGQGTASGVRTVINTGNDGYTGLTVKGFSPTQSANLQQWETSTGSVLASINPSGVIRSTGGFANLTTINNSLLLAGTNGLVASRNIADGNLAFIVNNQLGTAGIQAWQQGGVQVAQIFSDGSLRTPYVANTTTANNSKIETNTTGTLVSRNIADANPAFIANSTLGVSDIARFQQGGVTVAKIPLNGTVTASTDLTTKSYNDATYAPLYLSTTATLDFPNVLMEQNEVLTTTVTGAAVGDVVTLGLPDNILSTMTTYNGTFQAWVSAANTVSIRFQNNDSMNAHDLASGSFKIKVLK